VKVGDLVGHRGCKKSIVGIITTDHGHIAHNKRKIVGVLWNDGERNSHNEDDLEMVSEGR
jgi:hypothetical protein